MVVALPRGREFNAATGRRGSQHKRAATSHGYNATARWRDYESKDWEGQSQKYLRVQTLFLAEISGVLCILSARGGFSNALNGATTVKGAIIGIAAAHKIIKFTE